MVLRIEDISFIGVYVNDSFRDFKDINDYVNYHVSLLNNKRYQAFSGGDFIDRVVKGGYATDPNYKRALSNVYNQIAKAQEGMKIPKLKGAGELRARILRQFNREKAANRNEEQLIGFDWSRYKSNKPKPETTPTQSEQLENGGVIKAHDGIVTQAINKVKSILPKEEPKEPINVVDVAKEYAPSAVASMLLGNVNPFVSKLLEGKKPSLDYSHKFGSTGNKFEEFASVMTPIFKEALEENGLPTTNLNNLVRQAALESNYGLDPRGERGFNLSGIKHPGDSIAPKYKKSRYKDGFDYIDFDNLKDYANYKVKVLNDRYKALDAKDTNDFIDRLHGNNSGKYNYSADKDSYRRNLNGTLSLNKYLKRGGIVKYQNPSSGIQRLSQKAIADSLNYGWEGQDNFNKRQSRYTNVDPTGNFYNPGDWISNGWRTLWDSSRDNKGTPHEEALYLRYLGGKRDAAQLPQTSIRFSRDYDITDNAYPNKEYVGLPKEQKDAIRDNVVTNMQSELKEGVWAQVKDNVRRSRDQRGTGNALSGLGKFGLRNNNNSGIFDIADTYDYPSWIPIPDRNKGYELEIRDTIWTKDAKPELYKVENGYLPYNASPLQKWAKKEVDQLIRRYK